MTSTDHAGGTKPLIVLGVDGSWRETGALEWAGHASVLRGEPLSIAHVIDERLRTAPYSGHHLGRVGRRQQDAGGRASGIGSFQRLLIGSTSETLANQAQVPVVVVPDRWKASHDAAPVLVGIDDSPQSEVAIDFAAIAATERKVPLRLVHVWDLPIGYSWEALSFSEIEGDLAEHPPQIYPLGGPRQAGDQSVDRGSVRAAELAGND
jgi:nucleotide-binding universal stress UspA family protein